MKELKKVGNVSFVKSISFPMLPCRVWKDGEKYVYFFDVDDERVEIKTFDTIEGGKTEDEKDPFCLRCHEEVDGSMANEKEFFDEWIERTLNRKFDGDEKAYLYDVFISNTERFIGDDDIDAAEMLDYLFAEYLRYHVKDISPEEMLRAVERHFCAQHMH